MKHNGDNKAESLAHGQRSVNTAFHTLLSVTPGNGTNLAFMLDQS